MNDEVTTELKPTLSPDSVQPSTFNSYPEIKTQLVPITTWYNILQFFPNQVVFQDLPMLTEVTPIPVLTVTVI